MKNNIDAIHEEYKNLCEVVPEINIRNSAYVVNFFQSVRDVVPVYDSGGTYTPELKTMWDGSCRIIYNYKTRNNFLDTF